VLGFRGMVFELHAPCSGTRVSKPGHGDQRPRRTGQSRFEFRVSGFGFSGFGFQVSGFGFQVSGFGFRVSGFGLQVSGFRFRVSDFAVRCSGFIIHMRVPGREPWGERDLGLIVSGFGFGV